MTFNLPENREEVLTSLNTDVKANLPSSNSFLKSSLIGSFMAAIAGRVFDVYKKLEFLLTQFFINTATGEYLERWGAIFGINRKDATIASGLVTFTGIDSIEIPANTKLNSSNNIQFKTTSLSTISTESVVIDSMTRSGDIVTVNFISEHNLATNTVIDSISGAVPTDFNVTNPTIIVTSPTQFQFVQEGTGGSASTPGIASWTTSSVEIQAIEPAAAGNLVGGSPLVVQTPIPNVNDDVYVQFSEITNGTDIQSDTSFRKRILFRIQNPVSFFNDSALINQAQATVGVNTDRVFVFGADTTTSSLSSTGITRDGKVATLTTLNPHGLADGTFVTVSGVDQGDYNIVQQRCIRLTDTEIAYRVENSPTTPATSAGGINLSYGFVEEGQVRVYFTVLSNETPSASLVDTGIIPTGASVNLVKENLLEIKPAHVAETDLIVAAPVAKIVNIEFASLFPNTENMQETITNTLVDYFRNEVNVGEDLTLLDLDTVIRNVTDNEGNRPSFTLSDPSSNVSIEPGELAIKGVITYP